MSSSSLDQYFTSLRATKQLCDINERSNFVLIRDDAATSMGPEDLPLMLSSNCSCIYPHVSKNSDNYVEFSSSSRMHVEHDRHQCYQKQLRKRGAAGGGLLSPSSSSPIYAPNQNRFYDANHHHHHQTNGAPGIQLSSSPAATTSPESPSLLSKQMGTGPASSTTSSPTAKTWSSSSLPPIVPKGGVVFPPMSASRTISLPGGLLGKKMLPPKFPLRQVSQ